MRWLLVWAALLASVAITQSSRARSLQDLVRRADLVFRAKTSAAVFEMKVKTKSYERSFKIVAWDDSRDGDKSLIKILGPASWRGHATLKIGDKLKLYNPKTNHVQVVGASMLGNSWMGSHFSNDDLVKETRLARDYKLSLKKKWTAQAPIEKKATYYLIEMTPKSTAPVAWGRIEYELFEAGKAILPVKAHYYRKTADATAARSITFTEIKRLAGRQVPSTMTVKLRSKPNEYTQLIYSRLKLNIKIPSYKFSEQAMKH